MSCIKDFKNTLWQIIEGEILNFKREFEDNPEGFFDHFYKPNLIFNITLPGDENWEQRHADFVFELHDALLSEMPERYNENMEFTNYFGKINNVGLDYDNPQFPTEYLADVIDGFYNYVLPRIIFSKNPKDKFETYYESFSKDFLSEEASVLFYAKIENLFGDTYDLKLDQETRIEGYRGILPWDFNNQFIVEEFCFFREIKKRCQISKTFPSNVHDYSGHENYYYILAISNPKFNKKNLVISLNYFDFFRKIIFLIRMVCFSISYFEIIGARPFFDSITEMPAIGRFPGHKIDRSIFYRTDIKQHHKGKIKKLWESLKKIDYKLIYVTDFKFECCLKRGEITPPSGYDDQQTFSNLDRVLDLFQAIENILAAPTFQKGKYIKTVWPILTVPNRENTDNRREELKFIGEMWDIRNDYAHGDLDILLERFRTSGERNSLKSKTHLLAYKFTKMIQFLLENPDLIPEPGTRGKRNKGKLDSYCEENK